MSPETILIKRVKTQNGIFTTKRILVDNIDGTGNISSIDNIKDILINTKINIKKERKNMRLDEIKNSLDQGTKTPEEMAANNLRTNLANGTYIDITDEEEEKEAKPTKTESKKSTQKSDDDWD